MTTVDHDPGYAVPGNTAPFEFCPKCFLLRALDASLTDTLGWVRVAADYQLTLANLASEASHFQRWRAGTFGWPGNLFETIMSTSVEGNQQQVCLRASPTGDASTAFVCTDNLPPNECRANAAGERAEQCELYRWHAVALQNSWDGNVVSMFVCNGGSHCNSQMPLLGSAGNSSSAEPPAAFEVICDSSCGLGLNGAGWSPRGDVTIALLIGVALLPIALYLIHTVLHRRRNSADADPWPARRRPLAVLLVFEVSWVLCLVSLAPSILWLVDNLWKSRADVYLPLGVPAIVGMALCLRPDDPPIVFRIVSLLFTFGAIAFGGMVLMCLLFSFDRSAGACAAPVFLQDCPWTGAFQTWAIDAVGVAANVSTIIAAAIFTVSQSRILVPSWRYGLRGPQALRWLWKTFRNTFLALGSVYVLLWVVELILSLLIHESTVLERDFFSDQHRTHLWNSMINLFLYAISSPRFRLHLHTFGMNVCSTNLQSNFFRKLRLAKSYKIFDADLPPESPGIAMKTSSPAPDNLDSSEHDSDVQSTGRRSNPDTHPTIASCVWSNDSWDRIDLDAIWMAAETDAATNSAGKTHELSPPVTFDNIVPRGSIGSGGYSDVFCADLDGKRVAIKAFRRSSYMNKRELLRLGEEAKIALNLSHPNIVTTLGKVVLRGPRPALVLELMSGGSLQRMLHERPADAPPLSKEFAHKLVYEVALGLAYLHENNILHRDVKTGNVLLSADPFASWKQNGTSGCDETVSAKLCDFGIATRFGMEHTSDVGTARYMAPEIIFGPYNHMADVYSYALLVWETTHETIPFHDQHSVAAMILTCESHARPRCDIPRCVSAEMARLIEACWLEDPGRRPSMQVVCLELENIRNTSGRTGVGIPRRV